MSPGKKQHTEELIAFPHAAPKHHRAAWAGSQPAQKCPCPWGTHGVPLLTPSPLPRAAFQLEEAKHSTPLHTSELVTSHAATCGDAIKDWVRKPLQESLIWMGTSSSSLSTLPVSRAGNPRDAHTTSSTQGSDSCS